MKKVFSLLTLLSFVWLTQIPAIHAFDMMDGRKNTQKNITMHSMHTDSEGTCTKTEPTKKTSTDCCYEVATVDQLLTHSDSVEIVGIPVQSSAVPKNEPIISLSNPTNLHSTAPPEKPTSGRYAALVGTLKMSN